MVKEAKSQTEEGKATGVEPVETPPPEKGKSTEPIDWEKKATALEGYLKGAQKELAELKKGTQDYQLVIQKIEGLEGQFSLLTDIVSAGAEVNEELQDKVKRNREAQEARQKADAEAERVYGELVSEATRVGFTPDSDEMKPVRELLQKRQLHEALKETKKAVDLKIIKLRALEATPKEPTPEDKKVDKDKLKQITSTPAAPQEDLSPRGKILKGIADHRAKQ